MILGLAVLLLLQESHGFHNDPEPCTSENTSTVIISEEVSCIKVHELSNMSYFWLRPQLPDGRPLVLSDECACTFGCPSYLNDTLPANGTEKIKLFSTCYSPWRMMVRKCDGFYVFYVDSITHFYSEFRQETICLAPYQESCKKSKNSTDSDLHVCPEVRSFHEETEDGLTMEAVFKCLFQPVPGNIEYDVDWYIDGTLVNNARFSRVSYSNINDTVLRPRHWTNNFTMSFQVSCAVQANDMSSGTEGDFHESYTYFAGVKSDRIQYSVIEGETIQIGLQATVPFSCPPVLSDAMKASHCNFQFYIWTPGEEGKCVNGQISNGVAFKDNPCGIVFGYKDRRTSLSVTGYIDGLVNFRERRSILKVASTRNPMDSSGIWNGVNIPDITVIVKDKDVLVSGKFCASYTDPHQRTFDGKYFSNQRAGEFLLYRHKTLPYTVHVLYSACIWGRATCNCGIAIRSGGSLFSVRTCKEVSTTWTKTFQVPEEKSEICNENDLRIQKYWRYYTVTFPSGTVVSFSVSWWSSWVGSIRIRASVSDIGNTEGLCGLVNDDVTDDFLPKNGHSATDIDRFAESWRIPMNSADDSLFVENPKILSESFSYTIDDNTDNENYCTCPSDEPVNSYSPDFETRNQAHCNQTTPSSVCGSQVSMVTHTPSCGSALRRRKRSIEPDDVVDTTVLTYATDFDETAVFNVSDWINGWNATSARKFCEDAFAFDPAVETCNDLVNISSGSYIDSCVEDIKMSGNTTWVEDTLDTLKGACLTEAQKQEVFYTNSSSNSTEELSIIQLITAKLCPANCSGNGECREAVCSCNDGFIGSDCSARKSMPPTEFSLPSGGICDTSKRLCQRTNIAGTFYSEEVFARFTYIQVGETGFADNFTVTKNATLRHFNLITVSLPEIPESSRRLRRSVMDGVNGWNITLSYDGLTFGDQVTLLVYNSQKYSCETQTLTCQKLKIGTGIDSLSSKSGPSGHLAAIAGVVCGVVVIVTLMIIIILVKKKRIPNGRNQAVIGIQRDDIKQTPTSDTGFVLGGNGDYGPIISSLPPIQYVYQQKRAGTDISLHFDDKEN
ncbi:von Willebrand factor D and EGF domain-containing protein-like [Ostrea edulis]|uniref:von Willebrand factor D and EGF domain-containing protein-like n=1 Tax=Ostrea edulis TaxID=37623 RepID=UPI0024AF08BA|nr:von Willebrand factor D and EGF domain-containing protein-like [Ostrea edulis]